MILSESQTTKINLEQISAIKINSQNRPAYIDMISDMIKTGNGVFSIVLRIHGGRIGDYTCMDYADRKPIS